MSVLKIFLLIFLSLICIFDIIFIICCLVIDHELEDWQDEWSETDE